MDEGAGRACSLGRGFLFPAARSLCPFPSFVFFVGRLMFHFGSFLRIVYTPKGLIVTSHELKRTRNAFLQNMSCVYIANKIIRVLRSSVIYNEFVLLIIVCYNVARLMISK